MTIMKIVEEIDRAQNIAITSHVMPDGDNIGSMLALYNALSGMGKHVQVFSSDNPPHVFSFLSGYENIKNCTNQTKENFDILFVLDCGSIDRIGNCSKLTERSDKIINIDHHGTNSNFADISVIDTNASATGELVYDLIKQMKVDITKDIAYCLYTSILTDTGGFRYSNTSPKTHFIIAELISSGIDFGMIYDKIYRNFRYQDISALGKALSTIELYHDGKIAYMELLKNDIEDVVGYDCDHDNINTSDFIDFARDIEDVEVAVFVKEFASNEYKISLRSKSYVDVKLICEKNGGGGHVRAAGCTIIGNSIEEVKGKILKQIEAQVRCDKGDSIWME